MKESDKCLTESKNCGPKSKKKLGRNRRSFVRNIKRRQRRKRSHNRYYRHLRQLRKHRKYEELCSEVEDIEVFDISDDMDWKSAPTHTTKLPKDVTAWHQQEQVAYWKSRALSLEYENRMLYKHLRDVYAQQIEIASKNVNSGEKQSADSVQTKNDNKKLDEEMPDRKGKVLNSQFRLSKKSEPEQVIFKPPCESTGKKRREEMEKLYGSNCPKIAGIETALQLNFDHTLSKLKPAYWPQLQLNLG